MKAPEASGRGRVRQQKKTDCIDGDNRSGFPTDSTNANRVEDHLDELCSCLL